MNKHTENQVAAMLRRMDAYLYGESSEATAIIKDARELLDVCRAVGIQQEQLIMRYEAQQPAGDVVRDAERYRFLAERCRSASEHWRGRWWIVIDGPAPKSHDSEDDFDAAIDAALASSARKGE